MTAAHTTVSAANGFSVNNERSKLALAVQSKARAVVNEVKKRGNLNSVAWVAPLIAAPAAVSTMAILLKAASNSEVANLKVDNREVTAGVKCIGVLPYETLHGNLNHCGSVGTMAFTEARVKMDIIRQTADRMVKDDGTVEYILDLLEDPKGARRHLKSEMTAMGVSAKRSLDEIVALTEKFNDWYWIICCLMGNTFDGRGKTQEKVNHNEQRQEEAKGDLEKYGRREETTQRQIADLEAQRKEASDSVSKAQEEVDRLQNLPPIPEPPFHEEYIRAQNAITATDEDVSLLKKGKNKLFGESKSDKAARQERFAQLQKQRDEYMENAKKRRDEDRRIAADRLEKARAHELELLKLIDAANKELARNQTQLDKAKDNLTKTEATLRQLGEKRMGLEETLSILEESSRQLGELKDQVQKLVGFFESILSTIKTTVDEDVDTFLRTIDEGILTENINGTQVLESVDLSRSSKKRIISKALQIQASYSAIRHVTTTYVTISDDYIMPAISKMERLSLQKDEAWRTQSIEFTDWCNEAIGKIQNEAESAGRDMEPSMTERVVHLHEMLPQSVPV